MAAEFDLVIRGGTVVDGTGGALQEADIAISGGKIAAIGQFSGSGAEEIDARGRIVTPGFVDVHTHYDGQAIWSEEMSPSSSHGVTTAVMGNCGVGFAPCRQEDHDMLINVMEGVEDIPGVVMAEGLPWNWETFPEYLDVVAAGKRDIDVAAYLPHSPLRVYAMGERGARREPATSEDLARMRKLSREAMEAGALGFATSRLSIHKTADGGSIPTFQADVDELREICGGMADAGTGTLQIVLDAFVGWDKEYPIIDDLMRSSGRPATFTLASGNEGPPRWRGVLDMMEQSKAHGGQVTAQIMPRPIGLIGGLELSVHPFIMCPSWQKIAALPLDHRRHQRPRDQKRAPQIRRHHPVKLRHARLQKRRHRKRPRVVDQHVDRAEPLRHRRRHRRDRRLLAHVARKNFHRRRAAARAFRARPRHRLQLLFIPRDQRQLHAAHFLGEDVGDGLADSLRRTGNEHNGFFHGPQSLTPRSRRAQSKRPPPASSASRSPVAQRSTPGSRLRGPALSTPATQNPGSPP